MAYLASTRRLEPRARTTVRHRAGWEVREVRLGEGTELPAHAHPELTLVVQLEGGYTQRMRDRRVEVAAGDVVAIPAGEPHSERVQRSSRALLIRPTESVDTADVRSLGRRWVRLDGRSVRATVRSLAQELSNPDDVSHEAADALVFALLDRMRGEETQVAESPPLWLLSVREALDDGYRGAVELDALAEGAGVSRGHLTRVFRQVFGRSIGEYVRWRRVEAAAHGLADPETPLPTVAADAGFYDQSHLTRIFKRYVGVTPLSYRRSASVA